MLTTEFRSAPSTMYTSKDKTKTAGQLMSHVSELPRAATTSKTAARVTQRAALTSLFYTRPTTNPAGISQPALLSHPQDSNTGTGGLVYWPATPGMTPLLVAARMAKPRAWPCDSSNNRNRNKIQCQ